MKKKNLKKLLTTMLTLTILVSSIPVQADSVSMNGISLLSASENSAPISDELSAAEITADIPTDTLDSLMLPNPFMDQENEEDMTEAISVSNNGIKAISISENEISLLSAVAPDFTAPQGDLNMHRFYSKGYSSNSDNFVYINGALAFFKNDNWYVTPSQVTDTQYIWPDGSVDDIAAYQDYFYNNHMPVKYLKDIFGVDFSTSDFSCASGRLWTINDGTEFEWYELSSKTLYRTQKSSNGYEQVVDKVIPENDYTDGHYLYSESLMGGYAHGFYYYARLYSDSSKHMLFYDYDGVDYEEELSYRPKYMIDVVKDSLWYLASVDSSTKLVRHELGTDGGDTVIMTLSSYSYPRVIQLKGVDDKVFLLAGGFTSNYSVSAISLSDNTYEAIGSDNFYCKINEDESVLTLNTNGSGPSLGSAGNYSITSRVYYTYDKDGLSEAKYHDDFWGTGSYYVAEDKSGDNGYVLPSAYGTLNFIGRIGIPSDLSYTAGYDKPVVNGLNDFIRNYVYDGNITYENLSTATSIGASIGGYTVKSDGDCEDGLYIETTVGREDLYTPSLTDSHCKSTTGRKIEDATCEHADIYTYDCARCDKQDLERYESGNIDPSKHTAFTDERNIVVPATCTTSGEYGYKCYNCNKDVYLYEYLYQGNDLLDHNQRTEIRTTDNEGNVNIQSGTTYDDIKVIPPTGHYYITIENIKFPTCSDDGLVKKQCIYCGETHNEIVAALDHDFTVNEEIEGATCKHEGYASVTCNICGLKIKKYQLKKLEHSWELTDTNYSTESVDYGFYNDTGECTDNVTIYKTTYTYTCRNCGDTKVVEKPDVYSGMFGSTDSTGPAIFDEADESGKVYITQDSSGKFYQSTQTIHTLSEQLYGNITINGQGIKSFIGTQTDATNIAPSDLSRYCDGYSLVNAFTNSERYKSPEYTGTFDFYAYPSDMQLDITWDSGFNGNISYSVSSDDFSDNLPKKDKLYSIINITDDKYSVMSLETYGYTDYSIYSDDTFYDCSKATIYKLATVNGADFTAEEVLTMPVYPHQDNYYLIVVEPDYDGIKTALENFCNDFGYGAPYDHDGYNGYWTPQPSSPDPETRALGLEYFIFGAKLVTSAFPNGIIPADSVDYTRDGLITSGDEYSGDEYNVITEMEKSNIWHSYKYLLKAYDGCTVDNMAGQYIIHSFGNHGIYLDSTYYNGDYENESNIIAIPPSDWLISNPSFNWYVENEDGSRTAISDGSQIANFKFIITDDNKISAQTLTNIDEPVEIDISCDVTDSVGSVIKTYMGALVFDNLEPELDIIPDQSLTVADNMISVPKNKLIDLTATVKYLKEGTTDYVDTDETVVWYFRSASTQKLYRIETNGGLTEVDDQTFLPLATTGSNLLNAYSGANDNDIAFAPAENGTLIAKFTGRYGSTLRELGVSVYLTATSLSAVYNGDDIRVGENYNKSDVEVTVTYHDGSTKTLTPEEWTASSLIVTKVGNDNSYDAAYGGLTANYTVNGILVPTNLVAVYNGDPVKTGEKYSKGDVEVTVIYHTGLTKNLQPAQWTESGLKVTEVGDNGFTASYSTLVAPFKVPGYKEEVSLEAEYTGNDVKTGQNYDKDKVIVKVKYHDGSYSDKIPSSDWTESGLKVIREGNNDYTATYHGMAAPYVVVGYKQETGLSAVYEGDPIRTGENYSKTDVKVQIVYHDGSKSERLADSEWTESGLKVKAVGSGNVFTAAYNGLSTEFTVPGYKQEVGIIATYTGDPVKTGEDYFKTDVKVQVKYHDDSVSEPLSPSEWEVDSLHVIREGDNNFVAEYKTFAAGYIVPGYKQEVGITASYEGAPVKVGEKYSKGDVIVKIKYHDNSYSEPLLSSDWTESGLIVSKKDANDFTATYKTFSAPYTVTGYETEKHPIKISAIYTGEDIPVGTNYKKGDVIVTVYYDDNSTRELGDNEWADNGTLVKVVGKNDYIATYQDLASDYSVTGILVAKSIQAKYTGPDIAIGKEYGKADVKVQIIYHDDSVSEPLPVSEWKESSLIVGKAGDNEYTAYYDGMSADYAVTGFAVPVKLTAVYKGKPIDVGKNYSKDDVEVTVIYNDDSKMILSSDEWTADKTLVTVAGKNPYTATYEDLTAGYEVTGIKTITGIKAKYKGKPVRIGKKYNKSDVYVYVIYSDGSKERLSDDDWKASSRKVKKIGDNEFKATYKGFDTDFTVEGFETKLGDPVSYETPTQNVPVIVKTGVGSYMNLAIILLIAAIILLAIYFKKRK